MRERGPWSYRLRQRELGAVRKLHPAARQLLQPGGVHPRCSNLHVCRQAGMQGKCERHGGVVVRCGGEGRGEGKCASRASC
jgi:hypothetical protein